MNDNYDYDKLDNGSLTDNMGFYKAKNKKLKEKKKLDNLRRSKIFKRSMATLLALGVALGGIIYANDQMSDKDKIDKLGVDTEQDFGQSLSEDVKTEDDISLYDAYIDFVNEQRRQGIEVTISEEGYKSFRDQMVKSDVTTEQEANQSVYDAYIDSVNEQRDLGLEVTISEEGYKAFAEQYNDLSSRRVK